MKIVNLTPHTITIINNEQEEQLFSAGLARVQTTTEQVGKVNGIPINKVTFGKVTGLPETENDTVFIVSKIVAEACKDRKDLLIVDKTVRDESGQIIGCTAFARIF